jgi:hypothetical protein
VLRVGRLLRRSSRGCLYSAVRCASSLPASSTTSACTLQRQSASSSSWASRAFLAAGPPCKQGVERLLGVVACVVRHYVDHLSIGWLSFDEGGSACDGHAARAKFGLQDGNIRASVVNCLTRTPGPSGGLCASAVPRGVRGPPAHRGHVGQPPIRGVPFEELRVLGGQGRLEWRPMGAEDQELPGTICPSVTRPTRRATAASSGGPRKGCWSRSSGLWPRT